MKRALTMLLALVMSVSLFACGQKQTDQTDQGQDAQGWAEILSGIR